MRSGAKGDEIGAMNGPDPDRAPAGDSEDAEHGPGVLGSLPRTRPSVRSPRRAEARASGPEASGEQTDDETEIPHTDGKRGREAEVEALARAGISLAGEAATLGLRFAGRAAAALRDAVERR